MAIVNRIDLDTAGSRLESWLRGKLPGAEGLVVEDVSTPASNGVSSQMLVVDVKLTGSETDGNPRRFVARIQPPGEGIMQRYELGLECQIIDALRASGTVPVPNIVGFESDPEVLGSPYMVMEHVNGRTPSDMPPFTTGGWVLDLEPAQRSMMYENALEALTSIHRVDWTRHGLGTLARPGTGDVLGRQLDYWRDWFDWARAGESNPVLEAGFERLYRDRPAESGPTVLTWGDARIGNMIFADDMTVAAVLDWECATLAPPEYDLGWWLFCQQFHTEGIGAPLPEGFPDDDSIVSRYETLSGHTVRDIEYYRLFAGVQFGTYIHRQANLLKSLGMLPEDDLLGVNNPALNLLARLLDVPAPGESTSFRLS